MYDIKYMIGRIIYNLLAVHMPLSDSKCNFGSKKLRAFCGKMILCRCGENVNIEKGASFGKYVSLDDNSGIGVNALISNHVTIGKNVMMGPDCMIFTSNHVFKDIEIPMCQQGFSKPESVVIEDDVWIGARVVILPGVRVGKGSVIGAGSVVTKEIPPYTVVGGNPAHILKRRKE